ncbi:hypothetical protein [Clostridium scatologenes]|uniref:Uncharacterized protein n=1 Tax=Clostridium scatologenes TaxID=1548 RepID=A0A0E3K3Z1_CLOSL|nr:hypothetical protein [Clostridium scatologenes]AKA71555.1 hypothetical protein CSCA_4430 [Clostridium scatologenes]
MILKSVITKDPVFDVKSFNSSKVTKKDFIYTGVDIRNTFNENGTVKSWTGSADAYVKSNPNPVNEYGGNNEK